MYLTPNPYPGTIGTRAAAPITGTPRRADDRRMKGDIQMTDMRASSRPGFANNNRHLQELFRRYPKNPLLLTSEWPYPANTVFNAGATRLPSGETLLLVRVEDRRGVSHLTAARSEDGVTDWRIDPVPTMLPQPEQYP